MPSSNPDPEHPDVVLVTVDQLGAKWLEESTTDAFSTPNLDRLQESGVTFRNVYASNPLCAPARATLATGLTSSQHGVLTNGYVLDPEIPTFMQVLQSAGWTTGAFGKLHFQPVFKDPQPDYHVYGFDVTRIVENSGIGDWLAWVREERSDEYKTALATITGPENPALKRAGPNGEDISDQVAAVQDEWDWEQQGRPSDGPDAYTLPFPEEASQTNWITRNALEFINESTGPFFTHISYVQPHYPSRPPARCLDDVAIDAIPEPVPPKWTTDPNTPDCFLDGDPEQHTHLDVDPEEWRRRRQYYFADIVHLDEQLGRILDGIGDQGLEETYVVFLADHGELLFDHGFTGKGQKHYDANIRVPLVIAGPGLDEGTIRDEFVQLEDICPTILDLAGVNLAGCDNVSPFLDNTIDHFAGESLTPLCRGHIPEGWREAAFVESYNNIYSASPTHWARTIRTPEYRYTWYPLQSGEQLFDVSLDPDEQHNLVDEIDVTDLRTQLLEKIVLQDSPYSPRGLFSLGVP